jgi:hypothetical protein
LLLVRTDLRFTAVARVALAPGRLRPAETRELRFRALPWEDTFSAGLPLCLLLLGLFPSEAFFRADALAMMQPLSY